MAGRDGAELQRERHRTRREVLAAAGAAGMVGLAGCDGGTGDGATPTATATSPYANYPVEGDTVTIGVSVPQTGVYNGEGAELLAGYRLAATNLNDGGGFTDNGSFEELGNAGGIMGKRVELAVEDTESSTEGARESARTLVDEAGAVMLTGGASSDEAIALQEVAADRSVIHMMGFVPGNSLGGADCNALGFQEMFNATMAARALRQPLIDEFGNGMGYVQVSPQSDLGSSFESALRTEMQPGWAEIGVVETRVGTQNFEGPMREAADRDPEVVFLNYYGLDGAHALRQAKETFGDDVGIVVPLYNRSMAENAAGAIDDVIGTVHWHPVIQSHVSQMVIEAWSDEHAANQQFSRRPSDLVHLAYSQLFQYAAAVHRAGTFEPPAVVAELEDFSYDIGMGEETMRACDHRAQRPIPIVRGLPEPDELFGRYYETEELVTDVGYGCGEPPALQCSMGNV